MWLFLPEHKLELTFSSSESESSLLLASVFSIDQFFVLCTVNMYCYPPLFLTAN